MSQRARVRGEGRSFPGPTLRRRGLSVFAGCAVSLLSFPSMCHHGDGSHGFSLMARDPDLGEYWFC